MSKMSVKLTAGTNVGLVRQNNEDDFTVCADLSKPEWLIPQAGDFADLGEYGSLLVVADGMGGANAGEVASAIAIETVQHYFVPEKIAEVVNDDHLIQEFMKEVVRTADINIANRSNEDKATKGMGTTIVMAWLLGQRAYVCWCGDSRCYVYNQRKGLRRLSKDHSYVQGLVDKGELHPDLAIEHPLSNIITRCLGNNENRAEPDTCIYELNNADVLLLCSDGLCGLRRDFEIEELLNSHKDDLAVCRDELISSALSAGGHDNITVALCAVKLEGEDVEKEEEEVEEQQDEPLEEEKELSKTVSNHPAKPKKKKGVIWLVVLFLLAIAAALVWFFWLRHHPEMITGLFKK